MMGHSVRAAILVAVLSGSALCAEHGWPPTLRALPPVENARRAPTLPDAASFGPQVRPVSFDEQVDSPSLAEPILAPLPEDVGLTLSDLQDLAVAHHPALAQAASQVDALRGKWVQAGLFPNPVVGYVGEEMGSLGTSGLQGGFVTQRTIRPQRLALNRAVVAEEIARAEQRWAVQYQRTLTDVRIAYYAVLIAERRIRVARDLIRLSQEAVTTSKSLLQAAEISRVALLQAEVEAEQTRIVLAKAENESDVAWQRLKNAVAAPDLEIHDLAGSLDDAIPELDWDTSLDRILRHSPEIAAALAGTERARWALRKACADRIADVQFGVAVHHDERSGDTVSGLEIGLPLPVFDRNQGRIQQARAEIAAADSNVHRLELQLAQRFAGAYRRYGNARREAEAYRSSILDKAQQTMQLVDQGYRQGELDYLALLTAQRTYYRTNLAYIDALRELWIAVAEIDGLLLSDSLGAGAGQAAASN
jgi:cobalt-zinc-cadmium efflux system outer membrane protein